MNILRDLYSLCKIKKLFQVASLEKYLIKKYFIIVFSKTQDKL